MLYKKVKNYTVLYLIIQIILYVSGKPIDNKETITISEDQLQYLIESVCPVLEEVSNAKFNSCEESFLQSQFLRNADPSSPEQPPAAKIRCSNVNDIKFQVRPSKNWKLVVLVPERTNDTEADKYSINFSLIEPSKEYEAVSTNPVANYTLWSTELQLEDPLDWQGGFVVPQYNERMIPENKKYDIKVEFFKEIVGTNVKALFTWNTTGHIDICFDIVNSCSNSGVSDYTILADSKPQKFLSNLSLNDACYVQVTGLYGITRLDYRTPACDDNSNCTTVSNRDPEIPQDVFIEAVENTEDTWNVQVNWTEPRYPVELYNVTLLDRNTSIVVAGDKTEVVFEDVSGTGLYTVELRAKLGRKIAVTSRRAIFPGAPTPDGWAAARGGTLGAAACAAAALLLACAWRRGRRSLHQPALEDEVPPKKGDIDGTSTPPETEDVWEVRSDKLLLHEVIGEGAFGVVRRATLAPEGTNVAVKMLKEFPSLEEIRSFRSEMELMKSVGAHPHLVSLLGVCSGRSPLIVAEYCTRGDLLTYLRYAVLSLIAVRCTWDVMISKRNAKYVYNNIDASDYRNDLFKCKMQMDNSNLVVNKMYELQDICDKELTTTDLLSFCRQIAMGMEFLAANRVVHRDLAARNVLVTADRTLKIADFGLSRDVYEENQYKQKGNGKMPIKWMALESLTRRIYTTQSDVWSFGIVMWEVVTVGAAPYASVPAARLPRLLRAGYRMPRPANCSPELYDIMLSCWREAPRERPTFSALHARLDELLLRESAHAYLTLEHEPEVPRAPPTPRHHRYLRMLIRGKQTWSLSENYERPLKPSQSNHYTSPPQVHTKVPAV